MRKYLCFVMAVVLLAALLAGCGGEVPAPTGPNTEPAEGSAPAPQGTGETLGDTATDRNFYVMAGGVERTEYWGGKCIFKFEIMTKEALDPSEVAVSVLTENTYEVSVTEQELDFRRTEYTHGHSKEHLLFYVYQNYLGVDFSLAGKLYDWYTDPPAEGSKEAEEMETVTQGRDPKAMFDELVNTGAEEFKTLTPEDTKEFYVYTVNITFDVTVAETVAEMDVTIGGETQHVELGNLRFELDPLPRAYSNDKESLWMDRVYFLETNACALYSNGMVEEMPLFEAVASDTIVLEELNLLQEGTQLLNLNIQVTTDGNTISSQWDGKRPFTAYAGDLVRINAVVQNELFSEMHYHVGLYCELVYSYNGERYSTIISGTYIPSLNYHEVYAIAFDGLDMEPYYRDYYYHIYEQWRKEYE